MAQQFAQPWMRTTVLISPEFYKMCKEHRIRFSDAMRTGISMLLAEKGIAEYDNNLNLFRKMTQFRLMAEEASEKLAAMEQKHDIQTH